MGIVRSSTIVSVCADHLEAPVGSRSSFALARILHKV